MANSDIWFTSNVKMPRVLTNWTVCNFTCQIITTGLRTIFTGRHIRLTIHNNRQKYSYTFTNVCGLQKAFQWKNVLPWDRIRQYKWQFYAYWVVFVLYGMIAHHPFITCIFVDVCCHVSHMGPKQGISLTSWPNSLMCLQKYNCIGGNLFQYCHILKGS